MTTPLWAMMDATQLPAQLALAPPTAHRAQNTLYLLDSAAELACLRDALSPMRTETRNAKR